MSSPPFLRMVNPNFLEDMDRTDSEESIDLEEEVMKKSQWDGYRPYVSALISIWFSVFYRTLIAIIAWLIQSPVWLLSFFNIGVVPSAMNKLLVIHNGKTYPLFLPKTIRVDAKGQVTRYLPRATIREVAIVSDDIETVWTKEFLSMAGPYHNFFGIPVKLTALYNVEGLVNPEIKISMKDGDYEEVVRTKANEFIDIYTFRVE